MLIALFYELGYSLPTVISIMLFLMIYQVTLGAVVFTYLQETCVDSVVGVANQVVEITAFIMASITPPLFEHVGISSTFLILAGITVTGLFLLHFVTRDSTFGIHSETK